MRKFMILIALVLCWGGAWADLVARSGANELRLLAEPCMHAGILAMLHPEYRPQFRKARATVNGKMFYACWIEQDGVAFVLYEDGDRSVFQVSAFKDEPGV